MAELADALASGASDSSIVQVQILLAAPKISQAIFLYSSFIVHHSSFFIVPFLNVMKS